MYSPSKVALLMKNDYEITNTVPLIDEWHISVISYEGTFEQPIFLYAVNKKNKNFKDSVITAAKHAQTIFEKLMLGDIDKETFYDIKSQFEKTETVSLQKTKFMEWLDSNDNSSGVFNSELFYKVKDDDKDPYSFESDVFEVVKPSENVETVVAGSWQSLFIEEIRAIYDNLRLCSNCGKPLPSGSYKGSYCPDTPENKQCLADRQNLRKQKERKLASKRKGHN